MMESKYKEYKNGYKEAESEIGSIVAFFKLRLADLKQTGCSEDFITGFKDCLNDSLQF